MKILYNFKKKIGEGFSPILIIITIGLIIAGLGYYAFKYTSIFGNPNRQISNSFKILEDIKRPYNSTVPPESDISLEIDLQEGESSRVLGTDIFVTAEKVDDLTGQGCLGGAFGCADRANIEVSRQLVRKKLELFSPQSIGVIEEKKHQTTAFGYQITLVQLENKKITLRFELSE